MLQLPEVVKNILILNVTMYVVTLLGGEEVYQYLALYSPQSELFRPYQLVTHMFMHATTPIHILFNMLTLVMLGAPVELRLGPRRFLAYYLACGLGAAACQELSTYVELQNMTEAAYLMARDVPMVGASGAVYGVLVAFAMLFPRARLMLLFPPIPMRAPIFVSLFIAYDLFMGLGRSATNVAHFAHVGGALMGAILMLYWRYTYREW